MRVNIIGRSEGYEKGLKGDAFKIGINYWHPKLDILLEIHPEWHQYHLKLKSERENAIEADTMLLDHSNYPFAEVMQEFDTDYFGSSTDWAIAYVLHEFPPIEIHLYGVAMDDVGDHYEKRCATDFWCGIATGLGYKVVVHGPSTVMTTKDGLIYGLFTKMKEKA